MRGPNFPYKYLNLTLYLIIANMIFFVFKLIYPVTVEWFAMNPVMVVNYGQWWQVFTYMFTHADIMHLVVNMVVLFFFGTPVEQQLGSWEFLTFYLTVGILAGLFSLGFYWFTGSFNSWLLGASGVTFGIMLTFATFFPNSRIYILFVIPVKAKYLVLFYALYEVFSQVFNQGSGVAHLTHLAGFLFAFLYLWLRLKVNSLKILFNLKE